MDNFLYNSLLTYFNTLSTLGYVNNKDTYKLIILSTIQELFEEWEYFITEEDYKYLTNALYCLYGSNCILPYPSNLGKNTLSYNLNGGITNPGINGTPGYINPEEGDNSKGYCLNMFERAELLTWNSVAEYNSSVVTEHILKGLPDFIQFTLSDSVWANKDFSVIKEFSYDTNINYIDSLGDIKSLTIKSVNLSDLVDIETNDEIHLMFYLSRRLPKSVISLITEGILTCSQSDILNNNNSVKSSNIVFDSESGCPIYIKRNLNAKRLCDKYISLHANESGEGKSEIGVPDNLYLLGLTYNNLQNNEGLIGSLPNNTTLMGFYANNTVYMTSENPSLFTTFPNTYLKTAYISKNHCIVLVIKPITDKWKNIHKKTSNLTTGDYLTLYATPNYNYVFYINKEKLLKNFK